MHSESFPREERLKSYKLIRELFQSGKRKVAYPVMVFYRPVVHEGQNVPIQFGVSVSRKKYKRAVDRNLLKRRIRESYRRNNLELKTFLSTHNMHLAVFFVFIGKDISSSKTIETSVKKLLDMLKPTIRE